MFYREAGQFKTSYEADQAIFPIAQDRWSVIALVAFAFLGVPLVAGQYLYTEVLLAPVLIRTFDLAGGGIENWFAYVLALVFLLFRPQGLFGERIIERV